MQYPHLMRNYFSFIYYSYNEINIDVGLFEFFKKYMLNSIMD